jgi:hypothetical protein
VIETHKWTAYNTAQCEEKTRFVALLSDLCNAVPQPLQEGRGRPRLPLSDMVFASVYKVYVGFRPGGSLATYGMHSWMVT